MILPAPVFAPVVVLASDEHGGGGRANNEITIEHGDWSHSVGRPLHEVLDPDGYGLPDANAKG